MKSIYAVYETDRWHSTDCYVLAGIYPSKKSAINAIVKNHNIEDEEFFDNIHDMIRLNKRERRAFIKEKLRSQLETIGQTQFYSYNYSIECINSNEWLL